MPPRKNKQTQKKEAEEPEKQIDEDNDEEEKAKPQAKGKVKKGKAEQEDSTATQTSGTVQGTLGDGKWKKDKIIISSWNINGIRAVNKKGDLQKYLVKDSPDILCINESKIDQTNFDSEKPNKIIPNEYFQYWNFCKPPNKGYAGVAIFSKVAPISIKHDLNISKHDQEGRTITLEFETFYLVSCYVPNAGQGLKRLSYRVKEWDVDFQKFLNELKKKKPTILCGDLNVAHHEIDIAKPKGNEKSAGFTKEEREQFTNFLNSGWTDTFRHLYPKEVQYSYWNSRTNAREQNIGWRLDYFVISNEGLKKVENSIINNKIYGSDHCPIELTLKI